MNEKMIAKELVKIAKSIVGYAGMDDFESAYVEAALWSSTDDNQDPLDSNYDVDDIDHGTLAKMKADCKKFESDVNNPCLKAGACGEVQVLARP